MQYNFIRISVYFLAESLDGVSWMDQEQLKVRIHLVETQDACRDERRTWWYKRKPMKRASDALGRVLGPLACATRIT